MRKIPSGPIAVCFLLLAMAFGLAIVSTSVLLGNLPLGDFRGLSLATVALAFLFGYAVMLYRLFLHFFPLQEGEIPPASRQEFIFHVHELFYLLLFNSVIRSALLPIPMSRMLYRALGARIGPNTYSPGIIYDACFVELGSDCVIGEQALLVPHVIEGKRLAVHPIRIGSRVTIGARATLLAGVFIEDEAIVATGSVVTKGTRIGTREVWGGIPARLLKTL